VTWENRYTFEVSKAAPDAPFDPVDLSLRIRDSIQPIELRAGRQDNTEQNQPSVLTLLLDNSDDALTYGNTLSPYPWWAPGLRCRLRETIAGVVMDRFTGFTQTADETVVTAGIDQKVSLTAVDRLGAMENGRKFISTLAEYINFHGAGTLQFYAPLNDVPRITDLISGANFAPSIYVTGGPTTAALMSSATGALALADDIGSHLNVVNAGAAGTIYGYLRNFPGGGVPLSVGQAVTVVGWVTPVQNPTAFGGVQPVIDLTITESTPTASSILEFGVSAGGTTWRAVYASGGMAGTLTTTRNVVFGDTVMFGVRYGYNPAVLEVWIGGDRFVGSLAGSPPASAVLSTLEFGSVAFGFLGALSHLQVYVSTDTSWGYSDYLAQYRMAQTCLERQSTGDRIRTVAGYAGIPNAEFANTIDPGASIMQRAQMAGRTALDLMREAETTEQGSLYVDGSGNLCFADRRTIYNV
jgi:hypothetical protein